MIGSARPFPHRQTTSRFGLRRITLGLAIGAGLLIGSSSVIAQARTDVAISAPWHVNTLDPAQDGYVFQRMQIAETLVDAGADGALRPGLATDWSVSEDGLRWSFTLREQVQFHNGDPLTAESVVVSLERAKAQPGILATAPIETITAEDGAVVVTLSEPFSALPAVLANYATIILAPASFDIDGTVLEMIGTGPFVLDEVSPPLSLKGRRFPDYWGEPAVLSEVRYLSSHRAEARTLMAQSGDADLVFTLDPAGYAQLADEPDIDVHAVAIPRVIVVKLNLARPSLAERTAREALSLAIDRQGIASAILRFPNASATQLFPPVLVGWHNPNLPPLTYDPDRARQLLAQLGWTVGDDGILMREGERFELTLRTFPNRPELPTIAAALQDQWRQIGVDLTVSVDNFSEIPAGHQDGSLDVALYARNYGLTPDPIVNAVDDFGKGGGDWGAMNWTAPAVHEALQTAAKTPAGPQREAAIAAVTQAIHTDLPVLPIAFYQHTVAANSALLGLVIDPLERTYGLSQLRWSQ